MERLGATRQRQGETTADPGAARRLQAAAHQLAQLAGNGHPQAGTAEAPTHGGVGLGEWIEDARQPVSGNADTGIFHADQQQSVLLDQLQLDPALLGELDGVAEQVEQYLPQAEGVGLQAGLRCPIIQQQFQSLALGLQLQHLDQLLAQGAQVEQLQLQLHRTALEPGGVQDVVEQAQQ